jgi:hypothetical protein
VFLQGQGVSVGKLVYDFELVVRDQDNLEKIASPMNWESEADPGRKKSDPPPIQYSKEKIYQYYLDAIANNERAIQRRINKAEAEEKQRQANGLLSKKVRELQELRNHLQVELREMNLASQNINGVLKNTRGKSTLSELNTIESFLKYGFPIF